MKCPQCGKEFSYAGKGPKKFCSKQCRMVHNQKVTADRVKERKLLEGFHGYPM